MTVANFKVNGNGKDIEKLIAAEEWKKAQKAIENQLVLRPKDHWMWSRLSGVKYERRDYKGALEAADKALEIVRDCPLAKWSKANALEMLDETDEAMKLYRALFLRGFEELKNPDADAKECWESPEWTASLMQDSVFRLAGCLSDVGRRDDSIQMYLAFLKLVELGKPGLYSREDALEKLKKLTAKKTVRQEAIVRGMENVVKELSLTD